jgi:hypothetical protein
MSSSTIILHAQKELGILTIYWGIPVNQPVYSQESSHESSLLIVTRLWSQVPVEYSIHNWIMFFTTPLTNKNRWLGCFSFLSGWQATSIYISWGLPEIGYPISRQTHAHIYIHINIFTYTYICIYVILCVYIYMLIYVYIYIIWYSICLSIHLKNIYIHIAGCVAPFFNGTP